MSGLLVPSDSAVPLALCPAEDSATAISDLLGGVLLDDARVRPLADGTAMTIGVGWLWPDPLPSGRGGEPAATFKPTWATPT